MVFIPHNQAPEVLNPGKKTLNLPSTLITAKFTAILGTQPFSVPFMGRDQFNGALIRKLLIKFIAVISLIANKTIRCIICEPAVDRRFNQFYFVGRSAFNVSGDRKTSSVCDGHDLGTFAALCLADSKTPFFAGTKVPSIKASRM